MKKVVLREDMMALTKDVTQALVLGQMLYWTKTLDKVNDWLFEENKRLAEADLPQHDYNYGWIYKSAKEMKDELMNAFSEDSIQRAFSALVSRGILMKRNNPFLRYDRKLHYRVDLVLMRRMLNEYGYEMTDFKLQSIPQDAECIPHIAESIPQIAESIPLCAETITENITEIKNKEYNIAVKTKNHPTGFPQCGSSAVGKNDEDLFSSQSCEENKPKKKKATDAQKPEDVCEEVWNDFLHLRKAKRAPLTGTALTRIRNQAEIAGISLEEALTISITRGWQSFEADWIRNSRQPEQTYTRAC